MSSLLEYLRQKINQNPIEAPTSKIKPAAEDWGKTLSQAMGQLGDFSVDPFSKRPDIPEAPAGEVPSYLCRSVSEPENFGFEADTRDQGKPYDELLNLAKQRGGMLIGGSDDPGEAARERAAGMDYEDFYKQAKQTGGLITGEGEGPSGRSSRG